ncbi:MAG: HemK2/MTQ2 family protein methyltransferase [Candidatus Thermoplasmatota archaeon]|nr:HemK2/MTQ2 family protein methyltransferase [Candidatus Thermoplasmatota archaeon]
MYEPAEDTLLLARHVTIEPGQRALDIGTGTGLLALLLARQGARVVATDVNPLALQLARANAERNRLTLDLVQTDLAQAIEARFDRITCNPPYLPTRPSDRVTGPLDRALSGGPDGAAVTRQVLRALPGLLSPGGHALLLVSSLQPEEELSTLAHDLGLGWEELERERQPGFEALACVRLGSVDPA